MNKRHIKKIIMIIFMIWIFMGVTDFAIAMTCHRPIFCINLIPDNHYEKYIGLGYSFDIVDNSKELLKIDAYKGYIFGKVVCRNYVEYYMHNYPYFVFYGKMYYKDEFLAYF